MNMILAIFLFVIFQFTPAVIDNRSSKFWQKSVSLLNKQRKKTSDDFYLWKFKRLYIRDPHAEPMRSHWMYSKRHPFCWYIK